jgi:hypothetical protein
MSQLTETLEPKAIMLRPYEADKRKEKTQVSVFFGSPLLLGAGKTRAQCGAKRYR